jgi:hypothetical protein
MVYRSKTTEKVKLDSRRIRRTVGDNEIIDCCDKELALFCDDMSITEINRNILEEIILQM